MPSGKLALLYPYFVLAAGVLAVLLGRMLRPSGSSRSSGTVITALVILAVAVLIAWLSPAEGDIYSIFYFDGFTRFMFIFSALATALAIFMASHSLEVAQNRFSEYTAILMTLCIGLSLMAASKNLLFTYLAIEMVSMSSYILTGFKRLDLASHEAALKYVIYGSVASAVMVFGMSLLFGLTGTISYSGIAQALGSAGIMVQAGQIGLFAMFIALMMVFTGFTFKIAAVPFHMWCPDVYQGAPTPFTGFLSVAPKAAGFALIMRFMAELFPAAAPSLTNSILMVLGLMSAVTMTLGNFSAIQQTNVKRLLAYSSIAQAGYVLMGVVVLSLAGSEAVLLYLLIYLFMNMGAFAVLQMIIDASGSEELSAFRGLGYRAPMTAFALAVFLFSLAGLPPLAGFIGKFYLFAAALKTGSNWYAALAVVAILNSVVALFYYVKIIREMYLSDEQAKMPRAISRPSLYVVVVMVVPVFILGLYWEPLQKLVEAAAAVLRLP